jgi:hypothetical protein
MLESQAIKVIPGTEEWKDGRVGQWSFAPQSSNLPFFQSPSLFPFLMNRRALEEHFAI